MIVLVSKFSGAFENLNRHYSYPYQMAYTNKKSSELVAQMQRENNIIVRPDYRTTSRFWYVEFESEADYLMFLLRWA